jgi:hypothetical protein
MTLPLLNDPAWVRAAVNDPAWVRAAVNDPAWVRAAVNDPAWVRAAVLGNGWPSGDEAAVWDVADRWYALADALAGPRTSAFAAADQIVAGLTGAGITPDGFRDAWEKLSGDEDAPLNALVQISAELGQMVEECGREIEAAKLAASIEVATVLAELAELSIAIELTLDAAGLAASSLLAASRVAVEQIYARLATRLSGKPAARPPTADPAHSATSDQRTIRLTLPGAKAEAAGLGPIIPVADAVEVGPATAAGRHAASSAGAIAGGATPSVAIARGATPSRTTARTATPGATADGATPRATPGSSTPGGATASGATPGDATPGPTPGCATPGDATPRATSGDATVGATGTAGRETREAIGEVGAGTRQLTPGEHSRLVDDNGVTTRRLAPRPRTGRRNLGDETRRLVAPSRPAVGRPTIAPQPAAGSDGDAFDRVRREDYADFLTTLADSIHAKLAIMGENPTLAAYADELEAEAALVRPRPGTPPGGPLPPDRPGAAASPARPGQAGTNPARPDQPGTATSPARADQPGTDQPGTDQPGTDQPGTTQAGTTARPARSDEAGMAPRSAGPDHIRTTPELARPRHSGTTAEPARPHHTDPTPGPTPPHHNDPTPELARPHQTDPTSELVRLDQGDTASEVARPDRIGAAPGWARPELQPDSAPGWALGGREWGRSAEEQIPGGLRRAHAVHLKALEGALPAADRRPDPRVGAWFSLLNAGGPAEDPTRGVNCLDAVLALFETYQRGRPRVAGPRTFDGYAHEAPDRAVGGEWLGVRRIQRAARSEFQNLCPFVGGAAAEQAGAAVDAAFRNLGNHLHNSGHGAFAFILTDFASGGCHAWAALNQDGTVLFLDPQLGRVSAGEPIYREIVSMDALVVDGDGEPAPLPYHGAGQWAAL